MKNTRRKFDLEISNVLYSLLTNLVSEKQIRSSVLNQTDLFDIVTEKLEENSNDCQLNLLGLLINLTSEPSDVFEKFHSKLTEIILKNLKNSIHHQRVLTLLGNILMHYSSIVSYLIEQQTIPWIRQLMAENDGEDVCRAAVRLLASCTNSNLQAQQAVAEQSKFVSLIFERIMKSENSLLIGNAALVLSNVISFVVAQGQLKKTPGPEKTVRQLLNLVEQSWLNKVAKKNLAVFLSKLVKSNEEFLEEFRRQHGTEILHSALKEVEI